jgi:tRNA U34 5-methylaminomethyl-2-thiouridine-forming methyltransferase MnmC
MEPVAVITKDGSHTLYSAEVDEHYHSLNGAISESMHVFIDAGFKATVKEQLNILEMGFGTGLNAFLTLLEVQASHKEVHYTGLEKYPLNDTIIGSLNYTSKYSVRDNEHFHLLHKVPWNISAEITCGFTLEKLEMDLCDFDLHETFDLVYFDAFSPEKQPELWSPAIFQELFKAMKPGAILTTYSSKGQVRRNMAGAGFSVEKIPGPPGKRDMIRAWKD